YVRSFAGSPAAADAGGRWIISKDGGQGIARWRDDGKQLIYADLKGVLWAVDLEMGTSVQARAPRQLFQVQPGANAVSVTGGLKRFLIPVPVEQQTPQAFTVMLNW